MTKREYRDYLKDIIDSITDIEDFIKGMTFRNFIKDKKTVNATVRSVEIIGEATKKIPQGLKDKYTKVPWKKMIGMRNKLIHEYFGIDMEILWKVAKDDIPLLKTLIYDMAKDLKVPHH